MKKQFIVEGEEELLSSKHHIFAFLFPMLGMIALTCVILIGCAIAIALDGVLLSFLSLVIFLWSLFCLYHILKAWIAWRYNFLIVTTEKIVIVNHVSFLHQQIQPIHIEDIRSTRTESQFFGIGNCGTLYIHLDEREGGSNQHVCVSYLPKPSVVVSMIENAVVLKKQRVPVDKGPEDQRQKVEEIKEKAGEAMKKD